MCDAVVEGVHPFEQRGQCVDRGAEKGENNRFARREVSTELSACGEGDHFVEAQFIESFTKEIPHVDNLFRRRGGGAGPCRGHRGRGERETLGGTMDRHLCSSRRVLNVVQLTESARGCSSLRVQSIMRFCTRSNVVFEKCRGREIAEAKLGEVVGETCPHDILSYVPSLRTTQQLFQEWNFRKGSQLGHLSQDQQLCHRIWLLFYDLGLNDQEILRFLIKEQYTIDLRVYVLL